jgi:hypothetical protein
MVIPTQTWLVPYSRNTEALESVGYKVRHIGGRLTADLAAESLEAATYAFLSELDAENRQKAYKALALHPDNGGDSEVMRAVNDAYHQTKR